MKITKEYDGLKKESNGDYIITGDLISDEGIEIELDGWLKVTGRIESKKTIKAVCGIEAGEEIIAGEGIEVREGIIAGKNIETGLSIACKWIKIGYGIEIEKDNK